VACLRQKPAADILNTQQRTGPWGRVIQPGVLPVAPQEAFKTGAFNQVPILLGATANEGRAAVYEQNDLINQPVTAAAYPRGLPTVPQYDDSTKRVVAFDSFGPRLANDMATNHQCSFWAADLGQAAPAK
jgi:hypothetical protein